MLSARSVIHILVALKWKDLDLGQIVVRINGLVIRTLQDVETRPGMPEKSNVIEYHAT